MASIDRTRDASLIPRRASRNWSSVRALHDVTIHDPDGTLRLVGVQEGLVGLRLQRRDDPPATLIVLFPEAWLDDLDWDVWGWVLPRANRAWRRRPPGSRHVVMGWPRRLARPGPDAVSSG